MSKVKVPVARPVIGAAGKTGIWRVSRPVVDYSRCTLCGICWLYCPDSVVEISEDKKRVVIDYDYCKGCGICSVECPFNAIKMVREEVR